MTCDLFPSQSRTLGPVRSGLWWTPNPDYTVASAGQEERQDEMAGQGAYPFVRLLPVTREIEQGGLLA